MKNKKEILFKYIVILAVLIIPFMYSFFYLKAYWNPYGEGNIDNLPVAIVNNDTGKQGKKLVDSIIDSKKLKIAIVNDEKAENGLENGTYYAVINIPKSFSDDLKSASSTNKKHATITYSPNQKSNYLASQIINSVVNAANKNLDNNVNSEIISSLSSKLNNIPNQLTKISDGFNELNNGTNKLEAGALELNNGINSAYNGSKEISNVLTNSINNISNSPSIDDETVNYIKNEAVNSINNTFTDDYKNNIGSTAATKAKDIATNNALNSLKENENYIYYNNLKIAIENNNDLKQTILYYNSIASSYGLQTISTIDELCKTSLVDTNSQLYNAQLASTCSNYSTIKNVVNLMETITEKTASSVAYSVAYQTAIEASQTAAIETASKVSENVAIKVANNATNKTVESLKKLSSSIDELSNGLYKLNNGSKELSNGTVLLNASVENAKKELNNNIEKNKTELKALDGLDEYSKEPVIINTNPTNEITSYGTAFAPLFISIALWVGSLMMFIVFYYDPKNRFKKLSIENKNTVERNLYYHVLATISGIILGVLLQLLLNIEITNIYLYYLVLILVSNMFMAIIQFLIVNFNDIGKFIALIILVLQLAASGGTFPIETVTKGFRWMNNILPMTYTIRLIKETIITIENNLLFKNLIIVSIIFVVFFTITLVIDIIKKINN